jgi:hypothetical protein
MSVFLLVWVCGLLFQVSQAVFVAAVMQAACKGRLRPSSYTTDGNKPKQL